MGARWGTIDSIFESLLLETRRPPRPPTGVMALG